MNTEPFVTAVREAQILDAEQLGHLEDLRTVYPDPETFSKQLLLNGTLTPYQIEQVKRGQAAGLVLGQYVLLDVLGEGGMGQVFKARHQRMKRLVALKVIRKDLAVGPEDVRRFTKEIEAAAALSHPNVVMAFDANEIDGTLFFVMEYVEGIDLGRLVKQHGPVAMAQACDYVRQAAIGLQHAHERGLVHRDIKPSNLLLTYADGLVKVLDLGLARLQESANTPTGQLTGTGVIMGTPDFMSPEQSRDARAADIRSDIYSLGCSLYYLLGRVVPFPGGTITEKLLQHNMEEPRPIRELRPDLSADLAAVIQQMMAKRPAERYPTPAAVAAALAPFAAAPSSAEHYRPHAEKKADKGSETPAQLSNSATPPFGSLAPAKGASAAPVSQTQVLATPKSATPWRTVAPRRRAALLVPLVIGALLVAAFVSAFVLLRPPTPSDPPAPVVAERPKEPPSAPPTAAAKPPRQVPEKKTVDPAPPVPPVVPPPAAAAAKPPEPVRVDAAAPPPEPVRGGAPPSLLLGVLAKFDQPTKPATLRTALSSNGEWALTSFDGRAQLWHLSADHREERPAEQLSVSFQPTALAVLADGSRVVMARLADDPTTPDGKVPLVLPFVSVWSPKGSRKEQLLRGHSADVTAVALSPRGNFALSGGDDRSVRLWNLGTRSAKVLGTHEDRISCVAYAADGTHGLSADRSGKVVLWDLETGARLATFDQHRCIVSSLAFSPDGRFAVSGGHDGSIYLYDVEKRLCVRSCEGSGDAVKGLAFAPDNLHFVSGGEDQKLRLWDVHEREPIKSFDEHNAVVLSVAFAADGRHVVFICGDQSIRRCELHQP